MIEIEDYIMMILDPNKKLENSDYSVLEGIEIKINKVIIPKVIVNLVSEDK